MKCPNCGAPMSGATCIYCGSTSATAPVTAPASSPSSDYEKITWGNRSLPDKILIILGGLWCLIVLVVAIELAYWRPVEIIATLIAASPGIVLLMIGFRRKKSKAAGKKRPGA